MTSPKTRHLNAVENVFGIYLSEDDLSGLEEHIEALEEKNGALVGCLTASGFAWLIVTVYSFWISPDAALLFAILSVGSFVFAWRGDLSSVRRDGG